MRTLVACTLLLAGAAASAAPVTPGKLHVVANVDTEVAAKPGDVVEVNIPNPARARVSELDVSVTGGVKLAGVVEAERAGRAVPLGSHIAIIAAVERGDRGGTIEYSSKDGQGVTHRHKVTVQTAG
jgi:hypothetical protein